MSNRYPSGKVVVGVMPDLYSDDVTLVETNKHSDESNGGVVNDLDPPRRVSKIQYGCTPPLEPIFAQEIRSGIYKRYFDQSSSIDLFVSSQLQQTTSNIDEIREPAITSIIRPVLNKLNSTTMNLRSWFFLGLLMPLIWIIGGVHATYAKREFLTSHKHALLPRSALADLHYWATVNQVLAVMVGIVLFILLIMIPILIVTRN